MYERQWQHLYHDRRWVRGRVIHLSKHPLCGYCLQIGITTKATIVDHIKPHKGNDALFFDHNNWQSLCKPCHDGPKQLEESRGCQVGHDIDGMPIGKDHPWNKEQ